MPSNGTVDTAAEEQSTEQNEFDVLGWATLGPSATIHVPANQSIEDVPHDEAIDALRAELRDRGFTTEQIEQMHIEVDYIEKPFSG